MSEANEGSMKDDGMRPEYDFSSAQRMPNRFANQYAGDVRKVVLDPDVAAFYPSTVDINALLRALMPVLGNQKIHVAAAEHETVKA